MKKYLVLWFSLLVLPGAHAVEVAGVQLPDSVSAENGEKLVLNGAGIRKKFFIKVYVGALYLPKKTRSAKEAIAQPGAKQVTMHFIYDSVSKKKITDGWVDGFKANLDEETFQQLQPRLKRFNGWFGEMKKGEKIIFQYIPKRGTRVSVRGVDKGTIAGEDFMQALLKVWLGRKPADKDLKRAMLGR